MSKLWNLMPDEKIPGTLNVGYVMATVVQAVIFMTIIEVDFLTLISIIGAAVLGAFLGAGVVSGFSRRQVQIGMGSALLVASALMVLSMSGQGPAPGEALGLSGAKLAIAVGISMVLGALMMLGIGFYGPCLIMISLLGMDPRVSYPIMMGACAFLMPSGSIQFIRKGSYDLRTAIAFLIAGPLAVLIAAPLVDADSALLSAHPGAGRGPLHRDPDADLGGAGEGRRSRNGLKRKRPGVSSGPHLFSFETVYPAIVTVADGGAPTS